MRINGAGDAAQSSGALDVMPRPTSLYACAPFTNIVHPTALSSTLRSSSTFARSLRDMAERSPTLTSASIVVRPVCCACVSRGGFTSAHRRSLARTTFSCTTRSRATSRARVAKQLPNEPKDQSLVLRIIANKRTCQTNETRHTNVSCRFNDQAGGRSTPTTFDRGRNDIVAGSARAAEQGDVTAGSDIKGVRPIPGSPPTPHRSTAGTRERAPRRSCMSPPSAPRPHCLAARRK